MVLLSYPLHLVTLFTGSLPEPLGTNIHSLEAAPLTRTGAPYGTKQSPEPDT